MAGPTAEKSDPYNRIWIRDNSLVAISLQLAGESELATEITEGTLAIVEKNHQRVKSIIEHGKPHATEGNVSLLHPVYKTSGEELDTEWGWRQNDAIGNLLQSAGLIECGYEEASKMEGYSNDHYDDRYGTRYYDLAHLNPFMLGELAEPQIIEEIEHELLRDYGVIRYHGDHYMSGPKENQEAQWVLGLLMLGHAWLACSEPEKARAYLAKADSLRVNGGQLPEAYIYDNGRYVPCEHTPLVWCHALALALRRQLNQETIPEAQAS